MSYWDQERTDVLVRMWAAGYSSSVIARTLGKPATRNSCAGKAARMKLPPHAAPTREYSIAPPGPPKQPKPIRIKGPTRSNVTMMVRARKAPRPLPKPKAPQPPPIKKDNLANWADAWKPLPSIVPKPLEALDARDCHWPTYTDDEPRVFCGAPAQDGSSYCPHHTKVGKPHQ